MKTIILSIILIGCNAACGATRQIGPWGIKQCGQQLYVYDPSVDPAQREQMHAAFNYWNQVLGHKKYVDGGTVENAERSEGWILVRFTPEFVDKGVKPCGVTKFNFKIDGCATNTVIRMSEHCEEISTVATFQSAIRHEIGHASGLYPDGSHSDEPDDLMYYKMPNDIAEPKGLSEDELEAVRSLYE